MSEERTMRTKALGLVVFILVVLYVFFAFLISNEWKEASKPTPKKESQSFIVDGEDFGPMLDVAEEFTNAMAKGIGAFLAELMIDFLVALGTFITVGLFWSRCLRRKAVVEEKEALITLAVCAGAGVLLLLFAWFALHKDAFGAMVFYTVLLMISAIAIALRMEWLRKHPAEEEQTNNAEITK